MKASLADMQVMSLIGNAIIDMSEMLLNRVDLLVPLSASQKGTLLLAIESVKNIHWEEPASNVLEAYDLDQNYAYVVQELISICNSLIPIFLHVQEAQNQEINHLTGIFRGHQQYLTGLQEYLLNRGRYAHGLLSLAGMYGPLMQIAGTINQFMIENQALYPVTDKNQLAYIVAECKTHINLLNSLVFDRRCDENLFRKTCTHEVEEWKKIRKKLKLSLDFLVTHYKLNNQDVLLHYEIFRSMPSALQIDKYLQQGRYLAPSSDV